MSFGKRLRALREHRGMRQRDLAQLVELSRGSIANIEADRQEPTMSGLIRMSDALGVPIGVLAGTEPMPEMPAPPKVTVTAEFLVECDQHGLVGRFFGRLDAKDAQQKHQAADLAALISEEPSS